MLKQKNKYAPDVLDCISNLSNDEVFTSPKLANQMLDMLPQELFTNPRTKFLDPCCKSGVFLREITKRLDKGLEDIIPDKQKRIDHILHNQVYGIAITELTAQLSRRTLYCSKYACAINSDKDSALWENKEGNTLLAHSYSISEFTKKDENDFCINAIQGNIRFNKNIKHIYEKNVGTDGHVKRDSKTGKILYKPCPLCGANNENFKENEHAYELIHITEEQLEVFKNMQFDVIIGNPPYQLKVNETGKGLGAIPLYNKFIEQALKMKPRYLTMIIPSRWMTGGVGLDNFRRNMLNDSHISKIVDYIDSKEVFTGVDINGGICYFLYDESYNGECEFTNISSVGETKAKRKLNEFDVFIRHNNAISIIKKVLLKNEKKISEIGGCSPQTPYGFLSSYVGDEKLIKKDDCRLLTSKGWYYVRKESITKSTDTIDLYKPMISKLTAEHAGTPNKEGKYKIISRMEILKPTEICSQSYLTICPQKTQKEAENVCKYLKTNLVRFLILQTLSGMNLSISNFNFVPWLDFTKEYTDKDLYKRYDLTTEEIAYIESLIREFDNNKEE